MNMECQLNWERVPSDEDGVLDPLKADVYGVRFGPMSLCQNCIFLPLYNQNFIFLSTLVEYLMCP